MGIYRKDNQKEIAFPLGGIGAGCVSLSGNGRLVDWEIFNRPNRRSINEFTHFAVKAEKDGTVIDARVLQGDTDKDFSGNHIVSFGSSGYGHGVHRGTMAGTAHFREVTFDGFYPIAKLTYADEKFPGAAVMEAMNPFIPGNDKDSSIPAACFELSITNTTQDTLTYTAAFSCGNPFQKASRNRAFQKDGAAGIVMDSAEYGKDESAYGNMTAVVECPDILSRGVHGYDTGSHDSSVHDSSSHGSSCHDSSGHDSSGSEYLAYHASGYETFCQEYWFRGSWFDGLNLFWREFTKPGCLKNRSYDTLCGRNGNYKDVCTLGARAEIAPGEMKTFRFVLAWYVPNVEKYWAEEEPKPMWKNYYAGLFQSSEEAARYCLAQAGRLWRETRLFRDTLAGSTLPETVLDAIQGNIAILKSTTCLRLENGDFWAWEGVNEKSGSCEGSCAHVWNYAYAMPFLFPKLERSLRIQDYRYNTTESGEMKFRMMLPQGSEQWDFRACADGQFGGVMKFYRDWKICGDDGWLRKNWPEIKKSIEYAWSPQNQDKWDPDKSGVLTGRQHHTLDVEMFGPNSWLTGFYLGALEAGACMAEYLGENETAAEYRAIQERGKQYLEEELFNGTHYVQKIDLKERRILDQYEDAQSYWAEETQEIKYQIQKGSSIDQCLAQWHAGLMGLNRIFRKDHVKNAAESIYRLNFKSMRDNFNPCRVYCVDDEKGAVICSWADEKHKPAIPVPYTEETMTGFEYAAAGLMLQEGMEQEALEIVTAIRARYDGAKRNPWSEIECGSSYARAMASYALLLIYSGFTYDMCRKYIGFDPIHKPEEGRTAQFFWSIEGAWGQASFSDGEMAIEVLYGELTLRSLGVCGKTVEFKMEKVLTAGDGLNLKVE